MNALSVHFLCYKNFGIYLRRVILIFSPIEMSKGRGIVSLIGMLLLVGGIFMNEAKNNIIEYLPIPSQFSTQPEPLPIQSEPTLLAHYAPTPSSSRPPLPEIKVAPMIVSNENITNNKQDEIREEIVLSGEVTTVTSPATSETPTPEPTIPSPREPILPTDTFDTQDIQGATLTFLQKVFEKTQDTQVMNAILQELIDSYQFLAAKQFVENLTPRLLREVEVHLFLQSVFNSFSLASTTRSQTLQAALDEQYQTAKLTKEEYERYGGIIVLMQKDYPAFFEKAKYFKQNQYVTFATNLQTLQTQIANQSDMPAYYFDALVALHLFNQGYFQPAKVLALSVLKENKNYILPYQILAYASFLTNSREAAIEYLTTLTTLDSTGGDKYDFLIGIASYRNQQYAQSVLKLSQVKEKTYRLDAERYLALNYATLKQYSKLLSSREKLLGYQELKKSDFYNYFYQVLFVPYFKGETPTLYLQNPSLTQKYLTRCSELFTGKESVICNYGKIGYQLISGTTDATGFEESLKKLAENYPQGYLFHALGERYLIQGKPEEAKPYIIKAIGMARS